MSAIDLVRRAYADYGAAGPLQANPRWWHESLELDEGSAFPDGTVVRGRAAVARRLQDRHAISGGTALRVIALTDLGGGQVLAHLRMQARGRASGLVMPFDWWHVLTVRDDQIVRVRDFADRDSAVAAVAGP